MAYTSEHAQDALSKYGGDGDPVKKKKKSTAKQLMVKKTITNKKTGKTKEYARTPLHKSSLGEMFGDKKK